LPGFEVTGGILPENPVWFHAAGGGEAADGSPFDAMVSRGGQRRGSGQQRFWFLAAGRRGSGRQPF